MSLWSWMRERRKAPPPRARMGGLGPRPAHDASKPDWAGQRSLSAFPDCTKLLVSGEYRLMDLQTGETLYYGQKVVKPVTGEICTVEWGYPPQHEGGVGGVHVRTQGSGFLHPCKPADIGAKWCNGEDVA